MSHSLQLDWSLQSAAESLLPQVSALESDNYPADEACSPDNFRYRWANALPFFKVAVARSKHAHATSSSSSKPPPVLGFVVGTLSTSPQLSHDSMFEHAPQGEYLCIHSVCVARALQQQGLGRSILQDYVGQVKAEQAGKLRAIVLISKKPLVDFYIACGFQLRGLSDVAHGADPWYELRLELDGGVKATSLASPDAAQPATLNLPLDAVTTHPAPINENSSGSAGPSVGASPADPMPVWLDCDPGHDDALAIILTAFTPSLRLVGLSTVAGNQSIEKTTINARNILAVCGIDLPVHPGRDNPLKRAAVHCPEVHGESGLEGPQFPPLPEVGPGVKKAHEAIADAVLAADPAHPLTLIATGPLTNIALFILTHPELLPKVKQLVLMGGAVGVGNTDPAAEFNIEVDAEAASIVFNSQLDVTMVPLEVTHTALCTPAILARIAGIGGGTPFTALVSDLLLFFRDSYATFFGFESPPLHDPCAVAWLIAPGLFTARQMRVDVECESRLCYGRTVCDVYGFNKDGRPKNVRVCLQMKVPEFWDLMIGALEKANAQSCLNAADEGKRYVAKTATKPTSSPPAAAAAAAAPPAHHEAVPVAALVQMQNFPMFHAL